jgi:hypothetical protein
MNQPIQDRHEAPAAFVVIEVLRDIDPPAQQARPDVPLLAAEHTDVRFDQAVAVAEELVLGLPHLGQPLDALGVMAVIFLRERIVTQK